MSKGYVIARKTGVTVEFLSFELLDEIPCNFKWVSKPSDAFQFDSMKDLQFFRKHRRIKISVI